MSALLSPPGARRAAVALVALGPDRAAALLRRLPEDQVRSLAVAVAGLGEVDLAEVQAVVGDLSAGVATVAPVASPVDGFTRSVLVAALGEERGGVLASEVGGPQPFAWLEDLVRRDPARTAAALAQEPAAVVALAVAGVGLDCGASLLRALPADARDAVAVRIASLSAVDPAVVHEASTALQARLVTSPPTASVAVRGAGVLAKVVQRAGGEVTRSVLAAVEAADPEAGAQLRDALFTFEDLLALPDRTLQVLLQAVDGRSLAVAVAAGGPTALARIGSNLSSRARLALEEEVDLAGTPRRAEADVARRAVLAAARELETEGKIRLSQEDE